MFHVLRLGDRSGWEYVLRDSDALMAAFGTRIGHVVIVTCQRTPLNDQERAAVAALTDLGPRRTQLPSASR